MDKFFNSFGSYYSEAQLNTISFWAFPIGTFILIWLLAILIPKIFNRKQKLKTVFIINRAWVAGSSAVAAIIIGLICFWWTKNYFAEHPWQFSLLLSLFIAMLVSLIALYKLRNYYSNDGIKEITEQPKTPSQLDKTISFLKKSFSRSRLFILLPALGFSMLFFVLNKGTNLISIILDNTPSQGNSFIDAKAALNQTISQLDENNQIIITSFSDNPTKKTTFDEILKANSYNPTVDNSTSFTSKQDASSYVSSLNLSTAGSPIQEAIWQNFLFAKQNTENSPFKNKILLIITDGAENGAPVIPNKFFCKAEEFSNYYPVENIFIIDYFNMEGQDAAAAHQNNLFMQNATNCGYDVQKGSTKDDYNFALEQILTGFQNNWYLIYWTIAIFSIMTIIGLLINPKKIA